MSILVVLIFISALIGSGFLIAFIWAMKNGQYDDAETPAIRMLFDDKPASKQKKQNKGNVEENTD